MKIVIAPDSFKGTLTAREACECIEEGARQAGYTGEIVKVPVADGGEGTVQSLVDAMGGEIVTDVVTDPLGEPVEAPWGLLPGGGAVIEMAAASGLPLVPFPTPETALSATTRGTGELILSALERGSRDFIIGIGGSATSDAGIGMAEALGLRIHFRGEDPGVRGGQVLGRIEGLDTDAVDTRARESRFLVACDVDNPLYGERGAAHVYSPQKGADEAAVETIDAGLRSFARAVALSGVPDPSRIPGAGAAGGLGAGFVAFLGAKLRPGAGIVMEKVGLAKTVEGARLVVTGEGKMDGQTLFGKTPMAVAKIAKEKHVPVIGIAGTLGEGHEKLLEAGFDGLAAVGTTPAQIRRSITDPVPSLIDATERVFSVWLQRGARVSP